MTDHKKPTPEELEEGIKKSQEELEKLEKEEAAETPPPEDEDDEEITEDDQPDDTQEEDDEGDDLEEDAEEEPEQKPQKEVDYKERHAESTREAQRLYKNNVVMNKAIEEANNLPEPTEEELRQEYPNWEDATDTERLLLKDRLINKRFRETINKASLEQRKIDEWGDRVEKFVDDPKNLTEFPELEGKEEKFKQFASDKKLVGTDFSILISAFLHNEAKSVKKNKGKMFETGTGGSNDRPKPKTNKLTVEEGRLLMKTNWKEYRKRLNAGLIANE